MLALIHQKLKQMEQRVDIHKTQPEAWKALYDLSASLGKSSLSPINKHLIKVRVSQINSCAYCIDMHVKEAFKIGETQQRLFLLSAWKETSIFTDEEKALLALVEEVTLIHHKGVTAATYKAAEKFFSAETIGEIIIAAISMNAWNRIAVSTQMALN